MNNKYKIEPVTQKGGLVKENISDFVGKVFDNLDISEETKKDYLYRIKRFLSFVETRGFSLDVYIHYKKELQNDNSLGISSKNKYLITARVFLKELNRKGFLKQDITQNIKGFRQSNKHRKLGINNSEMQKILDYVRTLENTKENTRLKMIVSLFALQGLRQIEVIRLDFEDLNLHSKTALIQGKGSDDKEIIYLQPEVVKTIKEYTKAYRIKSGCLLASSSNRNKGSRITTRALRGIVKDLLNKLDIDKSTHSFRHYFTTKLIENYNGDLLQVRKYTRHKGIEMLQVYNDNILTEKDLPRFFGVFSDVKFI